MQKSFKEIVKETNREFLQAFKGYLPLVGILSMIIVLVEIIIIAFKFNEILGYFSLPLAVFGGFWGIQFINNVSYHWKP